MATNYTGTTAHSFLQLSNKVLGVYNLHDSNFTARLVKPLLDELAELGQLDNYLQWTEPLAKAVVNMQSRGLLVDKGALHEYKQQVKRELREADAIILEADTRGTISAPVGKSPNGLGSTQKLAHFLFEDLGLKAPKVTERGAASTDQETLYRVLTKLRKKDEHARPVIEQLFHRSRLKTILQRYLDLPIDPDGRVRATVNMAKVKTWRFAYDSPALQQYPPECRHVFRAAPGKVFLAADYSQLEARILAYLSDDRVSIAAFEQGRDIHAQNAMDLFGYSDHVWGEMEAGPRKLARNFAKTFLYGISYGGATESLKLKLYCPCPQCISKAPAVLDMKRTELKAVEVRWFTSHSAVRDFHKALKKQIQDHHYWDCPLGGRRQFFAPWSAELDRESKNAPCQTTASQKVNRDQVVLDRDYNAPIVLQRHDEFMLEIPENEVNYWADVCTKVMTAPLEDAGILTGVSFPIDIETGDTWGSLATLTNQ